MKFNNKWQIIFHLRNNPELRGKKKVFRFGIFKIHTFPDEGNYLEKKHYKGFRR